MALTPLVLQPIIDRVAANCPGYSKVDRAADSRTAIDERQNPMPAAFILEPAVIASGEPINSSGLITQELVYEIGVLTMVQNYAGKMGRLQSIEREGLQGELWAALIGWQPFTAGFAMSVQSGALVSFDDQVLFYVDTFRLQYRIRG